MGVPGLWDLLRPAATRSSLSALAKTAYQTNRHGLRALTIGIDASLWVFHAQVPTAGENPFLRTIWYKLCVLLQQPVLPVFVFDGPHKPGNKRGNKVGGAFGTSDRHSLLFKALLNDCGLEWWNAPGEAEAELAVMNRQGKIDAVLSDDVDALLFGATCLLRNNSATLSGTAHVASSKGDLKTYEIYRSSSIAEAWTSKEGTALRTEEDCRMAMVFVALLSGGDYVPEGLGSFGSITAFALAHAGMADQLPLFITSPQRFTSSAPGVQARMIDELRTNSTGHASRRNPAKAKTLTEMSPSDLFPHSSLQSYLQPATSPSHDLSSGWPGFGLGAPSLTRGKARYGGRGDLEGLSQACEKYFEWGTRDLVCKKFAGESTGVFGADIMGAARNRRLEMDRAEKGTTVGGGGGPSVQGRMTSFFGASTAGASSSRSKGAGTAQRSPTPGQASAPPYILKIERIRPDPTYPELTEYRLLYETRSFVDRVHASMRGHRIDPKYLSAVEREKLGLVAIPEEDDGDGAPSASQAKADPIAKGQARVWMAAWLVKDAWPSLVEDWDQKQAAKNAKVMGKGRTKSAGSTTPKKAKAAKAPAGGKGKKKAAAAAEVGDGAIENFFGSTQARVPSPVRAPSASLRTATRSDSPPARTQAKAKPPAKAEPSRQPSSASTGARSNAAAGPSRPRINVTEVITIEDSDEEVPEPVEPKRKAIDLSSTPTPPRRTSSRANTRKAPARKPSSRPLTLSSSHPPAAGISRPKVKKLPSGNSRIETIVISSDEGTPPRTRTVSPPDSLERLITRRTGRSILSPSSRQNTSSPPTRSSPRLAAKAIRAASPLHPPAKSASARLQTQMSLGMPIIASSSSRPSSKGPSAGPSTPRSTSPAPVPSLSPSKSRTAARSSPSPVAPSEAKKGRTKPRRSYVVLVDGGEEGGGVIDCTRGGRVLKDTSRY